MAGKIDKIILTNTAALKAKYGKSGAHSISVEIERLISSDRARGLTTRLVAIDDVRSMREFSAHPVTQATDARQNKQAVDDLYAALAPDYILLLGSIDVIPSQRLHNPVYTSPTGEDTDRNAAGDLPYACEAAYSPEVTDFVGPTRVVGRLPDIAGAGEPSYLLRLLKTAADARAMSIDAYRRRFAVTAQIWEASTRLSMRKIFGDSTGVLQVPPRSSNWPRKLVSARVHFINCHGASLASEFFGQPANDKPLYPVALKASQMDGKIARGTIASVECCYGAQLDRISPSHARLGICETYLTNSAWGFVGSTTIAYGDSAGNGQADLVCQYFMENVLAGASLGRAFLEARQKFVSTASPLHPLDLKTLAQFNLYGDPSIVAVRPRVPKGTLSRTPDVKSVQSERSARHDRRRTLFRTGFALSEREPITRRIATTEAASIRRALHARARSFNLRPRKMLSFAIRYRSTSRATPQGLVSKSLLPKAYHILFCRSRTATGREGSRRRLGIPNIVVLIGKEVNGALVSFAKIDSR